MSIGEFDHRKLQLRLRCLVCGVLDSDEVSVPGGASGVVDGQPVLVRSNRGEVTGTAKVTAAIRRGVVSIPHGHYGVNVNLLSDKDVIDPVTGMVCFHALCSCLKTSSSERCSMANFAASA